MSVCVFFLVNFVPVVHFCYCIKLTKTSGENFSKVESAGPKFESQMKSSLVSKYESHCFISKRNSYCSRSMSQMKLFFNAFITKKNSHKLEFKWKKEKNILRLIRNMRAISWTWNTNTFILIEMNRFNSIFINKSLYLKWICCPSHDISVKMCEG